MHPGGSWTVNKANTIRRMIETNNAMQEQNKLKAAKPKFYFSSFKELKNAAKKR